MTTPPHRLVLSLIVVAIVGLASSTFAGDAAKDFDTDLTVPDSPAFTILGVTPNSVVKPNTARNFATSVVNGADLRGNLQTGLAVDALPYMIFAGKDLTIEEYSRDPKWFNLKRQLARTELSIGTTKGTGSSDKAGRLGLGLRLTPWDEADPRLNAEIKDCIAKSKYLEPIEPCPDCKPRTEEDLKKLEPQLDACSSSARKYWNANGLTIGLAPSFITETGNVNGFKWDGFGTWTTLAVRLTDWGQWLTHVRYRSNENVSTGASSNQFYKQDSILIGTRLRVGTGTFNMSLETDFIHAEPKDKSTSNFYRVTIGLDVLLQKDLWLEVAVGGEGQNKNGNNTFILPMLKWALPNTPTYRPKQ